MRVHIQAVRESNNNRQSNDRQMYKARECGGRGDYYEKSLCWTTLRGCVLCVMGLYACPRGAMGRSESGPNACDKQCGKGAVDRAY